MAALNRFPVLYVVIREIEGAKKEAAAFRSRQDAQDVYDQAARVCDNDPDEMGNGDLTIVSQCWLYEADAADAEQALAHVHAGRGTLLASYATEDFLPSP